MQRREPGDADTGASYWLKRVGAIEASEDGSRLRVRLDSIAPGQPPIVVAVDDETELQTQGELVEVLGVRPPVRNRREPIR